MAQHYALDRTTSLIEQDSLALSDLARKVVLNGIVSDLIIYRRELANLATVEQRVRRVRDAGTTGDKLRVMRDALCGPRRRSYRA